MDIAYLVQTGHNYSMIYAVWIRLIRYQRKSNIIGMVNTSGYPCKGINTGLILLLIPSKVTT